MIQVNSQRSARGKANSLSRDGQAVALYSMSCLTDVEVTFTKYRVSYLYVVL